jgi:TAG lipase / lysophosphatidylethanolamine acyltransferase
MSFLESLQQTIWAILTFSWLRRRAAIHAAVQELTKVSKTAESYEQWHLLQGEIDRLLGLDTWRRGSESRHYDWFKISQQKREIERCQVNGDILNLCGMLRMHPVRNLYDILSPRLYTTAHAGTKLLIEDYVRQVQSCVSHLAAISGTQAGFNSQTKMELFHDTTHTFGRTTLVLQGGSAFSMCHIGVVKALHLRGLLPRIITGTATGALVAALVGVHTDDELLEVLTGKGIDLSSFQRSRTRRRKLADDAPSGTKWLQAVRRRSARFLRTGHIFNIRVLEECAQDNLGDVTFEEAFSKTGRILNVTVALPNEVGIPQLLNYITAPHVLIWSAVVASTATSKTFYAPVQLYCKNETGSTEPFVANDLPALRSKPASSSFPSSSSSSTTTRGIAKLHEAPLKRIGELFNVNHFIVSQTRPYLAPFVRAEQNYPSQHYLPAPVLNTFVRLLSGEVFHLLSQLNALGWLPTTLCRLLMDETIPSNSRWAKISLTPDLTFRDLLALFDTPTEHLLDEWIMRGERSVWPAIPELRVRCGIEFELERAYESVRRRSPDQLGVEFAG